MFETPEDKTSQNLPVLAQNPTGLIQHSPGVLDAWEPINPGYVPSENKFLAGSIQQAGHKKIGWFERDYRLPTVLTKIVKLLLSMSIKMVLFLSRRVK